ncbi:uncharacterized protein L199_005105 [Kwoniella botswanensis]|uniref:uncharacterized protein n=1 Tax=Kwoniella botswanensis TaxID=1268659 RepID=UPI00315C84AB
MSSSTSQATRKLTEADLRGADPTTYSPPPPKNWRLLNRQARPQYYEGWKTALEKVSSEGELGGIEPSRIPYIAPVHAGELLVSLGIKPGLTQRPYIQRWTLDDIVDYTNTVKGRIRGLTDEKSWCAEDNETYKDLYDNKLSKDLFFLRKRENLRADGGGGIAKIADRRKIMEDIHFLSYYDSLRQTHTAIPSIMEDVTSQVQNRIRTILKEDHTSGRQKTLKVLKDFVDTRKEYLNSLYQGDKITLDRLSDKTQEFRDLLDSFDKDANARTMKYLVNSGKIMLDYIPFTDLGSMGIGVQQLVENPSTIARGNERRGDDFKRQTHTHHTNTSFGISRDTMTEPEMRDIARHTLQESLDNFKYNPDRINVKSEGEVITRDAMRLVHDVEMLYSDWVENYKVENGLDDNDVIEHINKHRSKDKSHTEEEATKAANLRKTQGQFVHSIKDYRSTAQNVVDTIISKINDRESELDQYNDENQDDMVTSRMVGVFLNKLKADRDRISSLALPLRDHSKTFFSKEKKRLHNSSSGYISKSKDLFEPLRGALSENVPTWEQFLGLGEEDRQKAHVALTARTDNGKTTNPDSVVKSEESITDTVSQAEVVDSLVNSSEDGSQDGSMAGKLSWADIDEDEDKVWQAQFGSPGQISSI